jgi:transposase
LPAGKGSVDRFVEDQSSLPGRWYDLFSDLSVVFMDTTSLSFYGEGGTTLGENGFSKNFRPDLKQMILGSVIDGDGWPICTEMWPGNTADVATLLIVIDRLRQRFAIRRVCVVADRGMISAATISGLEERGLEYILGARERSEVMAKALVLNNNDPFVPLLIERKRGETQLFVKEVRVEGRRYIICRNETEAEKDRRERQVIVHALQEALRRGEKALIGNAAYRRYLRKRGTTRGERVFEIDAGKLAEEARFDGIFVLRTNAKVTPLQAVLRYRELLEVEQLFRQSKAVFDTRPIFHSSDAAIRGHVFSTFLALLLQKRLDDLAAAAGGKVEWRTLFRELDQLAQVRIRASDKDWLICTDATPAVAAIFRQAHIALPPRARQTHLLKPPPPKTPRRRRGRPRRGATSP